MKKIKLLALLAGTSLLLLNFAGTAQAAPHHGQFKRLYGADRFGTSTQIAENLYANRIQNIVVASGNGYADALSASVLANKLRAPIILMNNSLSDSTEPLDYIESHLAPGGKIYVVGGQGAVPAAFAQRFREMKYEVERLGGSDRYETDTLVASQLNVPLNTPIILASGNDYPDALGISSVAASKGWPILLSNKNKLAPSVQAFIKNDQPSQIYIVGGTGVITDKIDSLVQELAPSTTITRLGGANRFATLAEILDTFFPHPSQIYVASGEGYADALAGSPLAANQDAPILLVDPHSNQLPPAIVTYLLQLRAAGVQPQITTLGGTASVPDVLLQQIANYLGEQGVNQTTGTTTQTDLITAAIQQTTANASVVTINLSNPSLYAGATQYQILLNGNAVTSDTAIGASTTVYPAQYSGNTVQVRFYNASGIQVGAIANVVLSGTPTQMDVITGALQQTTASGSVLTINLSNPSTYNGATLYQVYVNGSAVSSMAAIGTATTVNSVQASGSTVQVKFYNANGTQVGAIANVVLSGTAIQMDVITGTSQAAASGGSLVTISLSNPSTYSGATQYQVYINGSAASSVTAIGTAATVFPARASGNTVQVEFFNVNGVQVGQLANVVLN